MKGIAYFLIFSLLFCSSLKSSKIEIFNWKKVPSPAYSDLHHLILFSSNSGIAAGKELLIYDGQSWEKFKNQPPAGINELSAVGLNSIFISSNNEYQESELYFWNGKKWKSIYHPLANTISSLHFVDKSTGVISGLGEVAIMKNNSWKFLTPPTHNAIISVKIDGEDNIWALTINDGLYRFKNKWTKIRNSSQIKKISLNKNVYVIGNNYFGKINNDSIKVLSTNKNLVNATQFSVLDDLNVYSVLSTGGTLNLVDNVWNKIDHQDLIGLNSIKMINSSNGWCVGNEGTIQKFSSAFEDSYKTESWIGFDKITFHSNSKIIDDEYGAVSADFNNDGMVDIFTAGLYENNHLYINNGGLKFSDEAVERGVSGKFEDAHFSQQFNLGACAGDFDNDGDIDLYVGSLNDKNKYYKNVGNGFFVDYTEISNGGGKKSDRTNSIATVDVDNDGDLEIFFTNENKSNRLLLNNGAGIFTEVTENVNLTTTNGGTGCAFADIDGDGDQDLYISNWSTPNKLYKNLLVETGTLKFTDITIKANVAGYNYTKSNGAVFADIDNDADLDLYVTNRKTSNRLYLNNGNGEFTDVTETYIGLDSLKSYGVVIEDFDIDGFKDIYVSNVGGNTFFRNVNGQKFIDYTSIYNADIAGYSTGSTSADFDNDGDLDLYLSNYIGESSTILVNKNKPQRYIELVLEGVKSNRSSIGTKISVYESGYVEETSHLLFFTEINGGSGYGSMNEFRKIIPTLGNKNVDIKIVFPSSITKILTNITPMTKLDISEINGFRKNWTQIKSSLHNLIFDHHKLFNLLKWMFILVLILISIIHGTKKYNWVPKIIIGSSFLIALNYYLLSSVFEYKNFVYSTLLPVASTITLITVFHLFYDKVMLRKKIELERQKLQEKLSRDLHDDLASTLGSISIYLELLKQALHNNSNSVWQLFNKANELLNNSKQTITDLIWTIKPNAEPLVSFISRIHENFSELFRERNINLNIKESNIPNDLELSSIEKHNLYLIFKEAFNNILKHSEARNVYIKFDYTSSSIVCHLNDDGKGFDLEATLNSGNGLSNIRNRCEEINAKCKINSKIEEGTIITISIKK